jgi:hypothetical protein
MENLCSVARQRAVMTKVADLIVAAARGRGLRVAVGCADPNKMAFADHLTRALYARGRPCRCLPSSRTQPAGTAVLPTTALITSDGPDDSDLCRIDIHLSITAAEQQPAAAPAPAGDHRRPDIVVDVADPDGPAIRHIGATLSPPI